MDLTMLIMYIFIIFIINNYLLKYCKNMNKFTIKIWVNYVHKYRSLFTRGYSEFPNFLCKFSEIPCELGHIPY